MLLNIKERLLLLNILPQENNFVTLKIVRKIQEELSFSEQELKEADIQTNEGKVFWNQSKNVEKEITIGEKATDIIIEALKKLDKENKLTMDFLELYEKFIKE